MQEASQSHQAIIAARKRRDHPYRCDLPEVFAQYVQMPCTTYRKGSVLVAAEIWQAWSLDQNDCASLLFRSVLGLVSERAWPPNIQRS
jgi:hypothetical protein